MATIEIIRNFFKDNEPVYQELKGFSNMILNQKISPEPNPDKLPESFKKGILTESNKQYKIPFEYFNFVLLEIFLEELKVKHICSFEDYSDFVNEVRKKLKPIKDDHLIWNAFDVFLFVYLNQEKKWDFKEYLLARKKDDKKRDYFTLQDNFFKALPYFKICLKENLLAILEHFLKETGEDLSRFFIFQGIEGFCRNNPKMGCTFVEYLKTLQKNDFLVSALKGLFDADSEKAFDFTKKIIYEGNFQKNAVLAFGEMNYKDIKYMNAALELLGSIKSKDENILWALATTYGKLIYNPIIERKGAIDHCFKKLKDLIQFDIPGVHFAILSGLNDPERGEKFKEKKFEIIMKFCKINSEYKGITELISYILADIKSPKMVLEFFKKWALNHEFETDNKLFEYPLMESYKFNHEEFISHLVGLLNHNKGMVRYSANNYLHMFFITDENRKIWESHLLDLQENEQLKIIKSVLNESMEPIQRLRLVLILKNNHNERIYHSLFQHLIWLTHDYGEEITDELKSNLNQEDEWENGLFNNFMEFRDKNVEKFNKKLSINEFDPNINQAKMIKKYNELSGKAQSIELQKTVDKKSLISQLTTRIRIGRGSKFGIEGQGNFSDFKHFQKKFLFPRTYFIFPEGYDFNHRQSYLQDWGREND
ncbi:MAG: hypothetical protein PVH61_36815 [Candidatus Aminicenantes bacterium]